MTLLEILRLFDRPVSVFTSSYATEMRANGRVMPEVIQRPGMRR